VPDALPRTKPKALNFVLPLCRGEFVVVYDAEDTPHPEQLWRAVDRFRSRPELECIQAQLLIDNGSEGELPALFAGEYAGLFTVLLPALARWGLPVPLGGTSNHFRLATLRLIGGWDAYNVTEDADLGLRLARLRLPVETMHCPTLEEAPTRLDVWLGQRSRWMKGWAQTFIVHNRDPVLLAQQTGWIPMLAFEVWALGTILAPLAHSGFLLTLIAQLALGITIFQGWFSWSSLYLAILLFGYGTAVAMTAVGLRRRKALDLLPYQLLLPLYWVLMVPAILRALYELTNNPFHWAKTKHNPVSADRELAAQEAVELDASQPVLGPVAVPSE
jgi:cellulose synthase/poly-beta-1,6-N-acetylglucosamine synthase-like glycosyltransferase